MILNRLRWWFRILAEECLFRREFRASVTSLVDQHSYLGTCCKVGRRSTVVRSTIGDYTYLSGDVQIKRSSVGKFCSIGPRVSVGGFGRHPTNWISTHPAFYSTRKQAGATFVSADRFDELVETEVGNDVWIGASAIILDGVKVGHGAIIGAGAVVAKDVEPYAIVGGVPARLIRKRFSSDVCDDLLELEWWNLPEETLRLVAPEFSAKREWTRLDVAALKATIEHLRVF